MKVVIVEDEQYTARDLADYISNLRENYEVVKVLSSVKQAIAYFSKETDYQLVFSDVQLGDGLSFEIYSKVAVKSPVIFCTAHNNFMIEAFKANGIDYVLKPFGKTEIEEAIAKFERLASQLNFNDKINNVHSTIKNKQQKIKSVVVFKKERIIPVKTDDIALLYIKNELVHLLCTDTEIYTINETLEELENKLGDSFYRVNRQYLINRSAIKDASHYFSRKLLINMHLPFDEQITVSKEKSPDFLNWLTNT